MNFPKKIFSNKSFFNSFRYFSTQPLPSPKVLVAVADGSEEIETFTPIDILRRAGSHVVVGKAKSFRGEPEKRSSPLICKLSRGAWIVR